MQLVILKIKWFVLTDFLLYCSHLTVPVLDLEKYLICGFEDCCELIKLFMFFTLEHFYNTIKMASSYAKRN